MCSILSLPWILNITGPYFGLSGLELVLTAAQLDPKGEVLEGGKNKKKIEGEEKGEKFPA